MIKIYEYAYPYIFIDCFMSEQRMKIHFNDVSLSASGFMFSLLIYLYLCWLHYSKGFFLLFSFFFILLVF